MVRFVNLEGKLKQFRRQMSEIHFDIKPESVGKCAQFCDYLYYPVSPAQSYGHKECLYLRNVRITHYASQVS